MVFLFSDTARPDDSEVDGGTLGMTVERTGIIKPWFYCDFHENHGSIVTSNKTMDLL